MIPAVPSAGEPVEFTVAVANDGPDPEVDVHVTDRLPTGLSIPAGMAAFVSQGAYDPDTGDWMLGDLDTDTQAVLTLPAEVGPDPPPCLVNVATVEPHPDHSARQRARASAAVRQSGVERCVDVAVRDAIFLVPEPFCANETSAGLSFVLQNHGPDEARDVVVTVELVPPQLPGFGFTNSDCGTGSSGLRCVVGALRPGGVRLFNAASAPFNTGNSFEMSLTVSATTTDEDHAAENQTIARTVVVPRTVVSPCPIPDPGIAPGGGGCFIATAAWGTPWHENVDTLKRFRDRVLLANESGRAFVRWYDRHSPPFAGYIADKPLWRAVVRAGLTPLVVAVHDPVTTEGHAE